jgi:alpha-tubulin suppressor-like RCC1 family protein
VPVTGITNAAQVSVGGDHVCALLTTGKIRCWGSNSNGQLGNGTTVDSNVPVTVLGIADALQVSAGYRRTCARLADDTVRCWGQGAGTGGIDDPTPVAIGGLTGVVQLTAGSWHHCALLGDGSVRCWGGNADGQLGDGTTTDALYPVSVTGSMPPFTQITAGSEHTCALDGSGEVWCWGWNGYGQLGQSSPPSVPVTTPTRAIGNLAATAVDAGAVNTCALVAGGSVSCWGNNSNGELGIGTTTSTFQPMLVLGLRDATSVSAGGSACAMLPGGRADCWGDNVSGQLGNGRTTDSAVPVAVIDP